MVLDFVMVHLIVYIISVKILNDVATYTLLDLYKSNLDHEMTNEMKRIVFPFLYIGNVI